MGSAAPNLHGRGADVSVSSRTSTTGRDSLAEPTSAADSLPIASVTAASRPGASRARGHRGWLRLVSPIVVLALWQILSTTGVVSQQKLPSLTTLWSTAVHLTTTNSPTYGTLQHAMLISLERVAIGFVIGGGLAMILAIVAGSVDIGGVGDAPPVFAAAGEGKVAIVGARITPAAAGCHRGPEELFHHHDRSAEGQDDRRAGRHHGRLPPAHRAGQGGPDQAAGDRVVR